ncbi:type II toxin-antitoxin system YafQ family toxin [Ruminiclostridium cellobioparum]|uniref:Addiction module toxin, RelE/StbE family n=1 Tax=Ruminiclostridium cellobioparum subsp. termitidis CT1112 TaxID=1195236 RepID=S0FF81_RUMCE|nr:type II toxin-antitoxin system YafQ family toxin [Ruminiclostridium cellobioparum]EMS69087.1 addiction module toxin, RelE/StbE family [Ruminiclostridium cellobioparum subsp. termitidis CT1112]
MNYEILATGRFKKDLKSIMKRGYNLQLLQGIVSLLAAGSPLPEKNKDHALSGIWLGHRECHITPDWLLIYKIDNDILVLTLTRTGTHSDLF